MVYLVWYISTIVFSMSKSINAQWHHQPFLKQNMKCSFNPADSYFTSGQETENIRNYAFCETSPIILPVKLLISSVSTGCRLSPIVLLKVQRIEVVRSHWETSWECNGVPKWPVYSNSCKLWCFCWYRNDWFPVWKMVTNLFFCLSLTIGFRWTIAIYPNHWRKNYITSILSDTFHTVLCLIL